MKHTTINKQLEEALFESADLVYDKAHESCDKDCLSYHASWICLRLLDLVSSPVLHEDFYYETLSKCLFDICNVLISGTADFTLLAFIIDIARQKKIKPNIYVLDICDTPLYACDWYSNKVDYPITVINEDILDYKNDNFYDVIITDSFLPRFDKENAKKVVRNWYNLLRNNGTIITCIKENESVLNLNIEESIAKYVEKVKERYEAYKDKLKPTTEEIATMAESSVRNIKSFYLGNFNELMSMFKGMETRHQINVTRESKSSRYIEITAKKIS